MPTTIASWMEAARPGCVKCKNNGASVWPLAISSGAPSHGWPVGMLDTKWFRFLGNNELIEVRWSPSDLRIRVLGPALRARKRATTDQSISSCDATGNPGSFIDERGWKIGRWWSREKKVSCHSLPSSASGSPQEFRKCTGRISIEVREHRWLAALRSHEGSRRFSRNIQ